ncbi:MAG: hypothetical protein IKV52_04740, partial [Oscillospiraceae bacterium]|nr:hypothetical protein [Oscillospiraceae bacterium]
MICNQCKKPIPSDSLFCIHCGKAVTQPQTEQTVVTATETAENAPAPTAIEQTATETPQIAETPAPKAETADNIAPKAENPQPAEKPKGKKLSFKGKMSAKMLTACVLAAVFALLNVVQLVSASSLRADNQRLLAKVDQLEATVQDYSQKLSQALEISPEEREIRDKAKRYDTLTSFVMEQSKQNNSKKYFPSTYLVVMSMEDAKQRFEITANFDEVTVYFDIDGDAVDARFAQNWRGTSIDV